MLDDALSRTALLTRADLKPETPDSAILDALTGVRVVVEGGADVLRTHSGQTAMVTAALTMARSGHEVWIDAPEVDILGPQPPLTGSSLLAGLSEVGLDLLPGRSIGIGQPALAPDLVVVVGAGRGRVVAPGVSRTCLAADDWFARIVAAPAAWQGGEWPLGAIAAGALAAGEAFKVAARRLRGWSRMPGFFDLQYAPAAVAEVMLAPPDTARTVDLPDFDVVSGGAIANAALFALLRLPGVRGRGRVLDDDASAMSNLNRNALLVRSALDRFKVVDLARFGGGLRLASDPVRFEDGMPLAPTVLVGVDHIPSRWAAQRAGPAWLGVGATEGFSVHVSSHAPRQPCVGCLHPVDAPMSDGPIPTAAFVSLMSGLLLVARWQRALGGEGAALADQQLFVNALRPEGWGFGAMPVAANPACPVMCTASSRRAAA